MTRNINSRYKRKWSRKTKGYTKGKPINKKNLPQIEK